MLFTSIELLRKSHADQSRVDTVEAHLKKLNQAWDNRWFFPTAAIGLSNFLADVHWVIHEPEVHLKNSGRALRVGRHAAPGTASELLKAVAGHTIQHLPVGEIPRYLKALDDTLTEFVGMPTSWTDGIAPTGARAPVSSGVDHHKPVAQKAAAPKAVPAKTPAKAVKLTRLDKLKKDFNEMTPKQKQDMYVYVCEKLKHAVANSSALGIEA